MAKQKPAVRVAQNDFEPIPFEDPGMVDQMMGAPEVNDIGAPSQADINAANMQLPQPGSHMEMVKQSITSPGQALLDMINSPEYKTKMEQLSQMGNQAIEEQRAGVNQNQAQLDKMSGQVNLQPLAKLTDTWTGSSLAEGMENPQVRQEKMMALQNAIQAQKQGLTKEQLELLKSQVTNPMNMLKQASTMQYQDRYAQGGPMAELASQRAALAARDKILGHLSNNKDLGTRLNAYQSLDNAMTNMAAGKIRTPQQLQDFQDAIIAGLGMTRGQSGVNERAERQFNTMDLKGSRLMQFLTSKPQDVMNNKELIGHLQDLARQEQTNVRGQYQKRIGALTAGYGDFSDKYPWFDQAIKDAVSKYGGQFNSPSVPELSKLKPGQRVHVGPEPRPYAGASGKSAAPKKKAVSSDVSADLDSMSPEELTKWMETHAN